MPKLVITMTILLASATIAVAQSNGPSPTPAPKRKGDRLSGDQGGARAVHPASGLNMERRMDGAEKRQPLPTPTPAAMPTPKPATTPAAKKQFDPKQQGQDAKSKNAQKKDIKEDKTSSSPDERPPK